MSSTPPSGAAARRPTLRWRPASEQGEVLVLLTHPTFGRSRVNRAMARALSGLDGVTVHDLYEAYPDQDIDVALEQRLLVGHRHLVWQHPFYWYSTPALLKEWQDHVLTFNWAYGPQGKALQGKRFLQAITTGGREEGYQPDGFNRYTIRQLLAPVEQTARLCGMEPLPPFVVHGTHRLDDATVAAAAEEYRAVILALRDGRIDPARVAELPRINHDLGALLGA